MGRRRTRVELTGGDRHLIWRILRTGPTKPRDQVRLRLLQLGAAGRWTLDDLARKLGKSRATVQTWLKKYRNGGVLGLLRRRKSPGSTSPIRRLGVLRELRSGMAGGRWRSAREAAEWLWTVHGIRRARKSIYYWLGEERL